MSRTDKDLPWRMGGKRTRYWVSPKHHAWFTTNCRRRARRAANSDVRRGVEPSPKMPVEYEYFD
jgi:hypothetical protein